MGLSITLCTYFAVEVSLSDFFNDTGERQKVCSRHESHDVGATARYCEHCGSEVKTKAAMKATELFRAFADKAGVSPEEAFEQLKENGWEWFDNHERHTIGLYEVQTVNHTDTTSDAVMALGVRLHRENAEYPDLRCVSYSRGDITKYSKILLEIMAELKLEGPPKLYAQIELGC